MTDPDDTIEIKPLKEVRKEHIRHVLQSTAGDLELASRILGISVAGLMRSIKLYGIPLGDEDKEIES